MAGSKKQIVEKDKAWFIAVLNAIDDLILVKGDKSRLKWANKAFLDYYGMTEESIEGIIDGEHSDPDNTIKYVRDDHYVFTTGKTLRINEPIINASGATEYFQTIKTPLRENNDAITGTVGVCRLIEDREIIESARKDHKVDKVSMGELQTLIQSIPLPVAMLDVKQRIIAQSQKWQNIFQRSDKSLISEEYSQTCNFFLPLAKELDVAINRGHPISKEAIPITLNSDERLIFNVQIQPWRIGGGDIGGVIVLLYDITRLKLNEQRLTIANDELAQFNYRVSHDLLAPLRSMKGLVNICETSLDEGNYKLAQKMVGQVTENIDKLSTLIQDMLNLARSDVMKVQKESVHLKDIIQNILSMHGHAIRSNQISVEILIPENFELQLEKVRVLQILENLVANAIKFFDPECKDRIIKIRASKENNVLTTNVIDNGIGVPSTLKDSIFEIFERGSSKHSGSGLGLYIVKKHLLKLNGSIRLIQDDQGFATNFEVVIPLI
ncbi:MAG: ATP-binding protein [Calditrichia bacterium]